MNWHTQKEEISISVDLWIGVDEWSTAATKTVEEYVNRAGLCVTMSWTSYIYTDGTTFGVRVGFRNYPRFPSDLSAILEHAKALGFLLAEACNQDSFMIEHVGGRTRWFSRRVPPKQAEQLTLDQGDA